MIGWSRVAVFSATICALASGRALAHPLGNFTINHLAVVSTDTRALRVHYVLKRAWIGEQTARVFQGLEIEANGNPLKLETLYASATTRPEAGGLPTLY